MIDYGGLKINEYEYQIQMSQNWLQISDGSWRASDRGEAEDTYTSTVKYYGREDYINSIITGMKADQETGEIEFVNLPEPIFGNHVDYTQGVKGVVLDAGFRAQGSLNAYGLEVVYEATQLSFIATPIELPDLTCVRIGYSGDTIQKFNVNSSMVNGWNSGSSVISTKDNDHGRFVGTFQLNYNEMAQLLNFWRLNRANDFDLPVFGGIEYPFGVLAGNTGLRARMKSISNIQRVSYILWYVDIEFVQEL